MGGWVRPNQQVSPPIYLLVWWWMLITTRFSNTFTPKSRSRKHSGFGIGTTDVVTLDFNPGNNRNRTKI